METNSEQSPAEGHLDPGHLAEDRVFDAIHDSDAPGFETRERQPDPEAPEMDFTLSLPGVGDFFLGDQGSPVVTEEG